MSRQEEEKANAQGNHAMSLKEKEKKVVEVRTSEGKRKKALGESMSEDRKKKKENDLPNPLP
jgi:hypothetical protein